MPDEVRELASLWLELVDVDIAMAKRALPDLVDPAAFHVQQAIEKALKAAIVLAGKEPPKIHDLKRLYDLAQPTLEWTASEVWLAERADWNAATRYRITDVMPKPAAQDVQDSFVSVERLVSEIRARLA